MEKLGFIGLGNAMEGIDCGFWLTQRLLEAGNTVYVWDKRPEVVAEVAEKGAIPCGSCKEVAEKATVIFMMMMHDRMIEEALFGENGVADGVQTGSVVIDMSSIAPERELEFYGKLKALGVEMIDAPANGGGARSRAKKSTLNLLVGGEKEIVDRCMPYLDVVGYSKVHIGPCGHGQIAKVATQMLNAIAIQGICEGLIYSSKLGADPMKIREAMLMRFIDEFLLEVHTFRPIDHMLEGFHVWEHQLDLQAALDAGRKYGITLPVTAMVQQMFNAVVGQGMGDLDHCSLILPLEMLAKQKVGEGVSIDVDWDVFFEYGAKNVENFNCLMKHGFKNQDSGK